MFTRPLSYSVSDPPIDMQIGGITLSNDKYFSTSMYTFVLDAANGATFSISEKSKIGVIIHFPEEYADIWNQIQTPDALNMSIGSDVYTSNNVTLSTRHLFAIYEPSAFPTQVDFTTFNVSFWFRNPNETIDCTILPVFTISLFDFKGNSMYSQTLSNK